MDRNYNNEENLAKNPKYQDETDIFRVNASTKRLWLWIISLILLGLVVFIFFDYFDIPEALEFLPGDKIWISITPLLAIGLVIFVIIRTFSLYANTVEGLRH